MLFFKKKKIQNDSIESIKIYKFITFVDIFAINDNIIIVFKNMKYF